MIILLLIFTVARVVAQICEYDNSVELTNRTYNGIKYEDGEYFVDEATGVERGCVCMKEICIRKCCPLGQALNKTSKQCVDSKEPFDPPMWEGSELKTELKATKAFHVMVKKVNCSAEKKEFKILYRDFTATHHLKTDGQYYTLSEKNKYIVHHPDKYCIDNIISEDNVTKTRTVELMTYLCYTPQTEDRSRYKIYSICMLISCFFMILTIAIYTSLPELRTLHGMVLITYLTCFVVAFLFMACMQLGLVLEIITRIYCIVLTFIVYFSLLGAFCWLNVMCYSLWKKIRMQGHGAREANRRRYISYCTYAFGLPTVLTVLLAVLEFTISPHSNVFLPRIRLQGCFLYGYGKLIYLYMPMVITCVVNLVFFVLIATKMAEIKKRMQQLNITYTQRFSLYVELFIVTGVTWILEVISFMFPDLKYLWMITDMYNCLVGLIIFIIFVCKRKVLVLIKRRYKEMVGAPVSPKHTSTKSSRSLGPSKEELPMDTNVLIDTLDDNK